MPVRIYDIAKRLGLPNKAVLQKAQELGITSARAASCSLDKITAEFLEQRLLNPSKNVPAMPAEIVASAPDTGDKQKSKPEAKTVKKKTTATKKKTTAKTSRTTKTDVAGAKKATTKAKAEPKEKVSENMESETQGIIETPTEEPTVKMETEVAVAPELQKAETEEKVGVKEVAMPVSENTTDKESLGGNTVEVPTSVEKQDTPEKQTEIESTPQSPVPVAENSKSVTESVPANPAPTAGAVPSASHLKNSRARQELETQVQRDLEALAAQPVKEQKKKILTQSSAHASAGVEPKSVQQKKEGLSVSTHTTKSEPPAPAKPQTKNSEGIGLISAKATTAAPVAQGPTASAVKSVPQFGFKPMWRMPISAIGKRAAELEEAQKNAAQKQPEPLPATPAVSTSTPSTDVAPKLGQKVGFIQLPGKNSKPGQGHNFKKDQQGNQSGNRSDGRTFQNRQGQSSQMQGNRNQQISNRRPAFAQNANQGANRNNQNNNQRFQNQNSFGGNPFQQKNQFQNSRSQNNPLGKNRQDRQDRFDRQDKQDRGQRDNRSFGKNRQGQDRQDRNGNQLPKLPENGTVITMKAPIVVRQLAELMGRKPFQLIADLMEQGVFANVNQSIEESVARKLCAKHGIRFELEKREKGGGLVKGDQKKIEIVDPEDKPEDMVPRPPVVTIMGHVDHGKTTLLDAIRKSNVAKGEAGGITQHIGAYTISIPHPENKGQLQKITFLDTPGHEAFSAMRARGANVTDIVILVVAANDGVMPQTVEAIRHAQAAKVTIMVAVNKCDHPAAAPDRIRQQLQEYGLLCEEWGGNTIFVNVSALTKVGVDELLGLLVLQAEMLELKANPKRNAKGNVVESGIAPGGPTATVLVRKGTLHLGDIIYCGEFYGKARALINEEGVRMKEAAPSEAVKLLGLNGVPEAGTEFVVVENEKIARGMAEELQAQNKLKEGRTQRAITMEGFLQNFGSEDAKVLKLVVKADTQGSEEAIVDALKKIESQKVSLEIVDSAVGAVTESDVLLASASQAVIVGFHTRIDASALETARREGVQIKLYSIIYELIDQVKDAMAGLLDPIVKETPLGQAEVRQVFNLSKGGNVAGCMVTQGHVHRGRCRVIRGGATIYEGQIQSLRRFQDEVSELQSGMECGIRLDGFQDSQVGDIIQSYSIEKIAQKL